MKKNSIRTDETCKRLSSGREALALSNKIEENRDGKRTTKKHNTDIIADSYLNIISCFIYFIIIMFLSISRIVLMHIFFVTSILGYVM